MIWSGTCVKKVGYRLKNTNFGAVWHAHKICWLSCTGLNWSLISKFNLGNFACELSTFSSSALVSNFDVSKCVLSLPIEVKDMNLLFHGPCKLYLSSIRVECTPLSLLRVLLTSLTGVLWSRTRVWCPLSPLCVSFVTNRSPSVLSDRLHCAACTFYLHCKCG